MKIGVVRIRQEEREKVGGEERRGRDSNVKTKKRKKERSRRKQHTE